MAAGFFNKTLSTLLSGSSRFVDFGDGTQAAVNGSIALDPTTGLPAEVRATLAITSGNFPSDPIHTLIADGGLTAGAQSASDPAATIFSVDWTNFVSCDVHILTIGTATIVYEITGDGLTWLPIAGAKADAGNGSNFSTQSTAAEIRSFRKTGARVRARVSNYTSGAISVAAYLSLAPAILPIGAVQGGNGEGSSASNNPIGSGLEARTSNKAAQSSGSMVKAIATAIGAAVIKKNSIPELEWSYAGASGGIVSSTTAVTLKAAAGAGIKNYLTSMQITHSTLGGATEIVVRDGASGTVKWRGYLNISDSPQNIVFDDPIQSSANTLLEFAALTSVTGAIYVNGQGYSAP